MRNLRANLSPVYYKNYIGQVEIEDQYGNVTGNFVPLYTSQKKAYLCVSPIKGVPKYTSLARKQIMTER